MRQPRRGAALSRRAAGPPASRFDEPGRLRYETYTPIRVDGCVFCEIVRGESPSWRVYEDESAYAFLSIFPASEWHTLVIPKAHHVDVFDAPVEALVGVIRAVKCVVDLYRRASVQAQRRDQRRGCQLGCRSAADSAACRNLLAGPRGWWHDPPIVGNQSAAFEPLATSQQFPARSVSGGLGLAVIVAALAVAGALFALGPAATLVGVVVAVLALASSGGLVVVQPNDSRVLIFFGRYTGSVTRPGFYFVNPFTAIWRHSVLLRVRNFQTERIKVNDASGSPIEIAAVVVWRVVDTAKAVFDVEDFQEFVVVQSETAVRHLASQYPYDTFDSDASSLLGKSDEVTDSLRDELQNRLAAAGIEVLETRLTHLAYAREIAEAMLRRQQAGAIVAARRTIVEGAVGLVDMALRELGEQGSVELDEQRKAAMAANLMLVLTGDRGATPVIDAGA